MMAHLGEQRASLCQRVYGLTVYGTNASVRLFSDGLGCIRLAAGTVGGVRFMK